MHVLMTREGVVGQGDVQPPPAVDAVLHEVVQVEVVVGHQVVSYPLPLS